MIEDCRTLDGLHILVVDDDPMVRRMLEETMRFAGACVVGADNAEAAIRTLAALGDPEGEWAPEVT